MLEQSSENTGPSSSSLVSIQTILNLNHPEHQYHHDLWNQAHYIAYYQKPLSVEEQVDVFKRYKNMLQSLSTYKPRQNTPLAFTTIRDRYYATTSFSESLCSYFDKVISKEDFFSLRIDPSQYFPSELPLQNARKAKDYLMPFLNHMHPKIFQLSTKEDTGESILTCMQKDLPLRPILEECAVLELIYKISSGKRGYDDNTHHYLSTLVTGLAEFSGSPLSSAEKSNIMDYCVDLAIRAAQNKEYGKEYKREHHADNGTSSSSKAAKRKHTSPESESKKYKPVTPVSPLVTTPSVTHDNNTPYSPAYRPSAMLSIPNPRRVVPVQGENSLPPVPLAFFPPPLGLHTHNTAVPQNYPYPQQLPLPQPSFPMSPFHNNPSPLPPWPGVYFPFPGYLDPYRTLAPQNYSPPQQLPLSQLSFSMSAVHNNPSPLPLQPLVYFPFPGYLDPYRTLVPQNYSPPQQPSLSQPSSSMSGARSSTRPPPLLNYTL